MFAQILTKLALAAGRRPAALAMAIAMAMVMAIAIAMAIVIAMAIARAPRRPPTIKHVKTRAIYK